jgi:hypothetical protein
MMKTFAFGFCTMWVLFSAGEDFVGRLEDGVEKEDWMKRAIFLATVALLAMLVFAPAVLAQQGTVMEGTAAAPLPGSGGPSILLPAAALLLGSGVLTYAILRRR